MKTQILPPPIARLLLAILMCLPVWGSRLSAQEPYAVYDKTTSTLTFKYGTKPAGAYSLNEGDYTPDWYNPDYNTNIITKVVFDASFANARPTSCHGWFLGCNYLTTIEGIENLNTENVTNMSDMFCDCRSLKTLYVSNFDTQNVTDMSYMFNRCYALTTLDISNFNTQNVTDMSSMFCDCFALTTLDVSNFDTKNVQSMYTMFAGCLALITLDVSKFDTKNVTDMRGMFSFNPLTTIYASDKFVTTACRSGDNMFVGCIHLVGAVPYDENKVGKEMANYTTGYFTYKAATGIDAPTVSDDTAAEYYDLQGRRLNAPQKGVNIVKRGKKTTKILVK